MSSAINYEQAVNSFSKYLAVEKGYSELTIKEYCGDLMLFKRYITEKGDINNEGKDIIVKITEIDRYQVSEFLSDVILEQDNAPVTRNRKLFSLRAFFKYLKKFDYIDENPTADIESSRTEQRAEPVYLKISSAQNYIQTIKESNGINVKRDLAIVKLFLYAGLRISELVNLDRHDIDFADHSIKFFGKGNKERYVPLHSDVIQAIKDYLPERGQIKPSGVDARQALFLSRQGNRINVRTIQLFVKKYARKAGLKNAEKITPHKLRHTFASLLYQKTKDLKVLQDLLGHADISTTQIYTHTDTEQRKKAINDLPDF